MLHRRGRTAAWRDWAFPITRAPQFSFPPHHPSLAPLPYALQTPGTAIGTFSLRKHHPQFHRPEGSGCRTMVRFHWPVEGGLSAWVPSGGMKLDEAAGVRHITLDMEVSFPLCQFPHSNCAL